MSQPLRAVFFDLDDTLFDHRYATQEALAALHDAEPMLGRWPFETLRSRHGAILEEIHREVVAGRMGIADARRGRFHRLLVEAGMDERGAGLAAPGLARRYREAYEAAWRAVDGAVDLLAALRGEGLTIAVVTNNLTVEQRLKMERCGLDRYVSALVTSEDVGAAKPSREIFEAALGATRTASDETVMVGDGWETDIAGALGAGIRPVWYNWRRLAPASPAVTELASFVPTAAARAAILAE